MREEGEEKGKARGSITCHYCEFFHLLLTMLRCLKFEREMHDCFGFEQQQLILGLKDYNNGILNEKVASWADDTVLFSKGKRGYNLVHTSYFHHQCCTNEMLSDIVICIHMCCID